MLLQIWKTVYPCFLVLEAHKTLSFIFSLYKENKTYLPTDMSIESLEIWIFQLKIEAKQINIY